MKLKVLIIEKERQSQKIIRDILKDGYDVTSISDFDEAYSSAVSLMPDIVIIDPLYPKSSGLKFIKALREWSDCQIIAVSYNGTERAAAEIIKSGADDFIRKPFFSEEFCARIERSVRQIKLLSAAKGITETPVYSYEGMELDFDSGEAKIDGKKIRLTKGELRILSLLCKNSGKVLTQDYIKKSVWGPAADGGSAVLRVNITNIRKKIEPDPKNPRYLLTKSGVGYLVNGNEWKPN